MSKLVILGNWVLLWVVIIEVQVELCIIDFWDLLFGTFSD